MRKTISLVFAAVLVAVGFTPAHATETQVVAIIDTGIYEYAKTNVIHEVCIIDVGRCQNNTGFQEGPNSATLPSNLLSKNGWDHGTTMAQIATQANPNVKIVFIRVTGSTSTGLRASVTEKVVQRALLWVAQNASKYGIDAVSASMGRQNYTVCTYNEMKNTIINLQSLGVATVFATGNGYKNRVDLPACINEAVAIGATETIGTATSISLYSNYGPELDFYVNGRWNVAGKNVIGTSGSAAAFAAYWSLVSDGSFSNTYAKIKSTTTVVKNSKTSGSLVSIK